MEEEEVQDAPVITTERVDHIPLLVGLMLLNS